MMKYLENTLNETAREAAERALGYRFKNRALLTQAFTRASYANEMKQIGLAVESNEVPEFFGDAILSAVVADYLFSSYATVDERGLHTDRAEGELTLEKISLTDKSTLSRRIRELGLDSYLLSTVGMHEVTVTDSMAEDLFEALACAVWVDSGRDFAVTREAVLRLLAPEKRTVSVTAATVTQKAASPLLSPKNAVQEFCDRHKIAFAYETVGQSGPDHDPTFTVRLTVEGIFATEASAKSRKAAETEAAARMLPYLDEDAIELPRPTAVTVQGGRTAKSEVKEWCDKRQLTPVYRVVEQSGPDHDLTFTVELTVPGLAATVASGRSKKAAETEAAAEMLKLLAVFGA